MRSYSFRAVVMGAACAVGVFGMVAGGSPAFGAQTETSSAGGGSTDPEPGSTADTVWNPDNHCEVPPEGWTIYQLLECLASYIDPTFPCHSTPGGGNLVPQPDPCPYPRSDFYVTYLTDRPGIRIVRVGPDASGSFEPARLWLRENSHNIQWTAVQVNRPGLMARIHDLEGVPAGGDIYLKLNNKDIPAVHTTVGSNLASLNQILFSRIQAAGFAAQYVPPYFYITADGTQKMTRLSLRSTDDGIYKSDLYLTPGVPIYLGDDGGIE